MTGREPEIGEPFTWVPSGFCEMEEQHALRVGALRTVTGEVVYVNREHGYYRVRAQLPGGAVLHECFKF